jgi:hypothetical protein
MKLYKALTPYAYNITVERLRFYEEMYFDQLFSKINANDVCVVFFFN